MDLFQKAYSELLVIIRKKNNRFFQDILLSYQVDDLTQLSL